MPLQLLPSVLPHLDPLVRRSSGGHVADDEIDIAVEIVVAGRHCGVAGKPELQGVALEAAALLLLQPDDPGQPRILIAGAPATSADATTS